MKKIKLEEVKKTRTLYLKFDTSNEKLKNAILDILQSHKGTDGVVIYCTKTKQAYKGTTMVNYNNLLQYELLAHIPEDCIKMVEK